MVKARIDKWDGSKWTTVLTCKFNPTQLTMSKENNYVPPPDAPNQNVKMPVFGGGKEASLTVNLFFDTTDTGADVRRQYTDKLLNLMDKGQQKSSKNMPPGTPTTSVDGTRRAQQTEATPPKVKFIWGKLISFEAYVTDVGLNFTYFLPNGTPVRATANLTLKQARDMDLWPSQNPTSRSAAREVWVVSEGETLDWIAYQHYGHSAWWRHIAEANGLANPLALRPGQLLKLTPLPNAARELALTG
jgi:phage tail protein X